MVLGLVLLLGAGCASAGSSETLRYKVTVTVTTPEGEKSGSAVREASTYSEKSILPDQGGTSFNITKGEAVVIDLGKQGKVFALMGGQEEARNVFEMLKGTGMNDPVAMTLEQLRRYPQFVYFSDLNNPKTIQRVDERKIVGGKVYGHNNGHELLGGGAVTAINLDQKLFGKGASFKEVTLALTDEPVTSGIEKWLPWLNQVYGYISGNFACDDKLYNCIDSGDLKKGEE